MAKIIYTRASEDETRTPGILNPFLFHIFYGHTHAFPYKLDEGNLVLLRMVEMISRFRFSTI